MLATIRSYHLKNSYPLATVDMRRYNQTQIHQSIVKNNLSDEELQVVGFEDWGISVNMPLKQAYQLRHYIESDCGGNEEIVKELLKKKWSVTAILSHRFNYVGQGDLNILTKLFEERSARNIALIVYSMGNSSEIIAKFISIGKIISTSKGFYLSQHKEA